jgi:hypothetical protein
MCVRNGRVQRKNRHVRTPNYYDDAMPALVVARERPGYGYRHVVSQSDVRQFVKLLPNWDELSDGLNAVVLARGNERCMGWHRSGVVAICAWDWDIRWSDACPEFCNEHRELFRKLDIPTHLSDDVLAVEFTRNTARAFLLVHVLLHELGHHHDRMTTRSKRWVSRGEAFAENYALRHEDVILARFRNEFEL